jgi:hypothetical protein
MLQPQLVQNDFDAALQEFKYQIFLSRYYLFFLGNARAPRKGCIGVLPKQ